VLQCVAVCCSVLQCVAVCCLSDDSLLTCVRNTGGPGTQGLRNDFLQRHCRLHQHQLHPRSRENFHHVAQVCHVCVGAGAGVDVGVGVVVVVLCCVGLNESSYTCGFVMSHA